MEGLLRVLDGSAIHRSLSAGDVGERARRRYAQLGDNGSGATADQVRAAAEAEAAALLLGSELVGSAAAGFIAGTAAGRLPEAGSSDARFDEATFEATLCEYLKTVADILREEPVVVSVLDGSIIRTLLEDEDEFAMAAENVFEELDQDNSGKLNRSELKSAVQQLAAAMGFPAPSVKPELDSLVMKLIAKYADQGNQELGQTQFAKLLQDVLQEMADSLAAKPIVVVRNVKVLDGSYLRKLLEDEKLLAEAAETTFKELDKNTDGKLSRSEIRPLFESKAVQWGLPPHKDAASEEIYSLVFSEIDADKSGDVDEQEFQTLMKAVFESFALQLSTSPIVVDMEAAAQQA